MFEEPDQGSGADGGVCPTRNLCHEPLGQAGLDEAVTLRNLHKMKGQPFEASALEFVFSTREIEHEARREDRRADAQNARSCGYDPDRYSGLVLQQAA